MENLSPQALSDFWKKGKTLYSAIYFFTSYELQKKYDDLEQQDKLKSPSSQNPIEILTIQRSLADVSEMIFCQQKRDSVRDELKWNLLGNILSEKIIGLGYEAPVKTDSKPKVIPLNFWPRNIKNIDWENSSFLKHGINFFDIRLIKKSKLKKRSENKKEILLPKTLISNKKVGRPHSGNELNAAYDLLKINNRIDFSQSLKAHEKLIQDTIKMLRQSDDASGADYKTICKYLGTRFKQDKESIN